MQWAIPDGLVANLSCHHNVDPLQKRWLSRFGNPKTYARSRTLDGTAHFFEDKTPSHPRSLREKCHLLNHYLSSVLHNYNVNWASRLVHDTTLMCIQVDGEMYEYYFLGTSWFFFVIFFFCITFKFLNSHRSLSHTLTHWKV